MERLVAVAFMVIKSGGLDLLWYPISTNLPIVIETGSCLIDFLWHALDFREWAQETLLLLASFAYFVSFHFKIAYTDSTEFPLYFTCLVHWFVLSDFAAMWEGYNQAAHVNCGNCRTALMYPNGSPSVKCPVCHYVTNVSVSASTHWLY